MRKPTKLGYCTTCPAKIMVFDTNGHPFKQRRNYCEVMVELSNGTTGKLAFCRGCLDKGFDAEVAIQNAIDGMTHDINKKNWPPEFKEWFLESYKGLKIIKIHRAVRIKKGEPIRHDAVPYERFIPKGKLRKAYRGKVKPRKMKPPSKEVFKKVAEWPRGGHDMKE